MATIGQALTAPESGWKRYDDSNGAIIYNPSPTKGTNASAYGGSYCWGTSMTVKFNFKGTKLRVIGYGGTAYSDAIEVKIDGISLGTFSQYETTNNNYQRLNYEITGLTDEIHQVELTNTKSTNFMMDAIDIDDTGRLLHPDEATDIKDLVVGKRIRFNYGATSGAVGTLSALGEETGAFIPVASSATPNGDAYFIMVDTDFKGRKILIADRNIQSSISWDVLNTAGIASGSGLPYAFSDLDICTDKTKAIASTTIVGGSAQWAFDNKNTSYNADAWEANTTTLPEWIGYDFGVGKERTVNKYAITTSSYPASNPISWIFQGSNDLTNWTDLHTLTNQTPFTSKERRVYSFENTTNYRAYRLYITAITTAGNYVMIGELEMMELNPDDSKYKFTLRLPTGGVSSTDKDNEWDNYIVNGTGNGAYTAGDNAVWNWSGVYSWASTTNSTSPTNKVTRGNVAGNTHTFASSNTGYGFRPVLVIESITPPPVNKYLFEDGSDIKKYDTGTWTAVGTAPATQAMFDVDGMNDLSQIDQAAIDSLASASPKLLVWTDAPSPTKTATLIAIPEGRVIYPVEDLNVKDGIEDLTVTTALTGEDVDLKILASVDEGTSWRAWNGSSWVAVNSADLAAVKSSGMTPDTFNSLTKANWTALLGTSTKIRFAYYLEQETSSDIVNVDKLEYHKPAAAAQTPSLDSVKITFDELTIEGRMQDLERINAINLAKLNFKSNALLTSTKYSLYDMVVDTFETGTTIESATASYDSVNKEYVGTTTATEVILPSENLPASRKKFMLNADLAGNVTFEYSLDNGASWNPIMPFTLIDLPTGSGKQLKVKAKLADGTAKFKGVAFSWA